MIIWINGAFGSGKTTIAEALKNRFSEACIYDPELMGDLINHLFPLSMRKDDFQDYPEWRQWNGQMLKKLSQEYCGIIIVPMTIYKVESYTEIIEMLREEAKPFLHVLLDVSKESILERLKKRNDGTLAWGSSKVDEILRAFDQMPVTEKLVYEDISVDEAVNEIFERWNISHPLFVERS